MNENSNIFDLKIDRNNLGELLEQCRKKQEFTDVKLKIRDNIFHAHRSVLSLYSPVLKAMISDQWSKEGFCEVGDEYVDVEIMEDLLSFLYTGIVKLTPDNVHSFCVAAHFLQIPILLDASVKQLSQQITIENVLTLFLFSTSCQLKMLQNACIHFIAANYESVFNDFKIQEFSFENFKDLIDGLKNQVSDSSLKEHTFHCIVRWAEKDLSKRSENLPILLEEIPLEELSYEFLTKTVSTQKSVIQSISFAQTLIKAFGKLQVTSNKPSNRFTAKQKLLVIGGDGPGNIKRASMPCYCPETETWKEYPLLPGISELKSNFAAVIDKQEIYICGGYVNQPAIATDKVEKFDWSSQTWTELPKLPIPLGSSSMIIHYGKLYVAGGDSDGRNGLSRVLCYSFDTRKWEYVKSMNVARTDAHLIKVKNHFYAIGGWTNTVEKYNPVLNEWTMMASMESAHKWFGATLHQGRIYVCGDDGFEMYNPETNEWTSLPVCIMGEGTSLVSMNDKLLAVGGKEKCLNGPNRIGCSIYEFDLSTQNWKFFCQLPSQMIHHRSLVVDFD